MKRFHKHSLQIAAAAILVAVLTLAAPRAAHAVAAALVNVTNTAASPAISQGVNLLASENVFLTPTTSSAPNKPVPLARHLPDGTASSSAFVVPSGQSLVVTTIDITPPSVAGSYQVIVYNGVNTHIRKILYVPGVFNIVFQFPSGIVFPEGESVYFRSVSGVAVDVHGYLTSN
jgi:hypothetical protein